MSSQSQLESHRFFISTPGTVLSDVPRNQTLQIKLRAPQAPICHQHRSPKMDPQFLMPQIHLWVTDTHPEAHPKSHSPSLKSWFREAPLKGEGTGA